jgi:hypothetical protein
MSKLSLDTLKERAQGVVTEELLGEISGGTEADCHFTGILDIDAKKAVSQQ